MPLFSIIVTAFNQAQYLPYTLGSVFTQTCQDFELLVIDDGSTDNTEELMAGYIRSKTPLQYFKKENGGPSSARNFGLKKASGTYIIFLDGDDAFLNDNLEILKKEISSDYDIYFTGYRYFNERNEIHHSVNATKLFNEEILIENISPIMAVCINRAFLTNIKGFDEALFRVEDWDLWIRCFKAGARAKNTSHIGAMYRIVDNSRSRDAVLNYESLKRVALSAVQLDKRLSATLPLNKKYNIIPTYGIQKSLAMCLGVAVMQGQLEEAEALYKRETEFLEIKWEKEDWAVMCSFLTFRYRYQTADVTQVLTLYPPLFRQFFRKIGYSKLQTKNIVKLIFKRHKKNQRYRYFYWIKSMINMKILRSHSKD